MQLKRSHLTLSHVVRFPRPAAGLASQSGRLIELLLEHLAGFAITSRDVEMRALSTLDSWCTRISMFRGFGYISITVDGFEARYNNLSAEADLKIVLDVQTRLISALSSHSPTLQYESESISGVGSYSTVGGAAARDAYFAQLHFPKMGSVHQDAGFKFRFTHPKEAKFVGTVEFAPSSLDASDIVISFDLDTSNLRDSLGERSKLGAELVSAAVASVGLEWTE